MGLTYTQTKQGSNINSLAVPTAPKRIDSTVAATKAFIPKSWTETLLPTLINSGVKAYGMYLDNNKEQAKQSIDKAYLKYKADNEKYKALQVAAEDGNIDTKDLQQIKEQTSGVAKLQRLKTLTTDVASIVDKAGVRGSDKEKLKLYYEKLFTVEHSQASEQAFDEKRKQYKDKISVAIDERLLSQFQTGTYSSSLDLEEYKNTLKAWGYSEDEVNSYLDKKVTDNLYGIRDNKTALLSIVNNLQGKKKLSLTDEKVLASSNSYLATIQKAEDTKQSRIEQQQLNNVKLEVRDFEAKPVGQAFDLASTGSVTPLSVLDTDPETYKKNIHLDYYTNNLATLGYTPNEIDNKVNTVRNKIYYKNLATALSKQYGKGVINLNLINDPKLKDLYKKDLTQEIQWGLSTGNFSYVDSLAANNPKLVSEYTKTFISKTFSDAIASGDVNTLKNLKMLTHAMPNTKLLTVKQQAAIDLLEVGGDNKLTVERVKDFIGDTTIKSVPEAHIQDLSKAIKNYPVSIQTEFTKTYSEFAFIYKNEDPKAIIQRTKDYYKHLEVGEDSRISAKLAHQFNYQPSDIYDYVNGVYKMNSVDSDELPSNTYITINAGQVQATHTDDNGVTTILYSTPINKFEEDLKRQSAIKLDNIVKDKNEESKHTFNIF